jgi:protein TonB
MNPTCKKLQETMAAEGPEVLQTDDAAQRHLEECEACFSFLGTLQELNASLLEMPTVDAPDHVVEELLARPELESPVETRVQTPTKPGIKIDWIRWTVWGSAAAFALLFITLAVPSLQRNRMAIPSEREAALDREQTRQQQEVDRLAELRRDIPEPPAYAPPEPKEHALGGTMEDASSSIAGVDVPADKKDEDSFAFEAGKAGELSRNEEEAPAGARLARARSPRKTKDVPPVYPEAAKQKGIQGTVTLRISIEQEGNVTQAEVVNAHPLLKQAAIGAVLQWKYEPQPAPVGIIVRVKFELEEPDSESLDGLAFHPTRGYWANTYLPGDPEMRFLHAKLQQFSSAQLQAFTGKTPRLHEAAHQPFQPFDSPENASMALYLHADRKGVSAEKRLVVQVGLKGIERRAGRRPAMNVGVVLDLRGDIPVGVAHGMRALLTELNRAKELGDRFRLVVAGRPGGVVLGPEEFRHGPLTAALDQMFAQDAPAGDHVLDIVEAVKTAIQEVGTDDDPAAVLGSSVVLLVTGQPLGEATQALATLAHQSAVAGIPVSAVGVGGNTLSNEINQVALSGQGNRRLLEKPSEAARLIDLELSAASRVVARAVRLNIRLAEGVRLVDILRSEPLDAVQAQQVREAEQSIDTRLNLNLGIEADRGEDEDGIQIVIPNFYAGDEHAILLDVVAPGSGAVAQVTMRYKDLAFLRNRVTQASLSLARGQETRDPLELNVLKNALAVRLAETLERAGMALSHGQTAEVASILTKHRDELTRHCSEIPGLQDADTRNDLELIEEYLLLLTTPAVQNASLRNHLADSLRYAGWLKIQPPLSVS